MFDTSLRESNPEWGVRDTADVGALAAQNGLALREIVEMPANNLILVFGRPRGGLTPMHSPRPLA